MVETLLVAALDPDWIRVGWRLLEACDKIAFPISDAFWRYVDENYEWSLYIASPVVEEQGILKAAPKLRQALGAIDESERAGIALREITPVEPTFFLVTEMRRRYGTVTEERGRVMRRTHVLPGEPFIYRLNQPVSTESAPSTKETVSTYA